MNMTELKGHDFVSNIKKRIEPSSTGSKILKSIVPGYDYRAKKDRLNTDYAVRNKLTRELDKSYDTLKEIGSLAYNDGCRDILQHITAAEGSIDLFKNKIENAAYGLSPFFKQEHVGDANIIKLIEFDANLVDELSVVTNATDLIYDNVLEGKTSDITIQMRKLKRDVDRMSNKFKDREDFLMNIA